LIHGCYLEFVQINKSAFYNKNPQATRSHSGVTILISKSPDKRTYLQVKAKKGE